MSGWPRIPFADLVTDVSGGNAKTPLGDYLSAGTYPVVDQGKSLVAGYTNDESALCKSLLPVIIFGDHTRCLKFVDFPFGMGADGVKVLRAGPSLEPKFLYHYLRQLRLPDEGYARHFKHLKRTEVPLPPIEKQRRISTILDQAEALRTQRSAALEQLDRLVRSVFLQMFGEPAANPRSLPLVSLGELGDWRSGGTPPRSSVHYFVGDVPWFSSGELESMYVFRSAETISDAALAETSAKRVRAGSLMLGMYDTAALKASIAGVDCSCNQAVAFSQIDPKYADAVYVYYAITIGREHFRRLQRGVRQKNLNLSMLREIRIPKPELRQQGEFVRRVKAIDALREAQSSAVELSSELFASLQHRAFSGQL